MSGVDRPSRLGIICWECLWFNWCEWCRNSL